MRVITTAPRAYMSVQQVILLTVWWCSMIEKLRMTSPDLTEANIDKLADLFPSVITETLDSDGNPQRSVDFDLLRQELSDHIVEGPQERYRLDWPGKRAAAFAANAPIAKTLRPVREESVDFDTTKNLFIEGDNLDALKLLQESYLGKVKLIYIDPPYNTGNDFVYQDDFAESSAEYLERSGQKSESGDRLVANPESNGRFHSDWLSMMYPRLKLARQLLTDDGILAISVDDNEQARIGQVLDELFGNSAKVAQVIIQANKGGRDYLPLAQTHEYLLIYAKTPGVGIYDLPRDISRLPLLDDSGPYEARELRNRNPKFNRSNRPNLFYQFYVNPELTDVNGYSAVSLTPRDGYTIRTVPVNSQGVEGCWRWGKDKAVESIVQDNPASSQVVARKVRSGGWNIYEKHRPSSQKAKTIWDETEVRTEAGTREVRELFGSSVFDHPKPVDLLKKILSIGSMKDSLILDFFAGSGSTAHAVMELNHTDGGNRRCISIQMPEKCQDGSAAAESGFTTISKLARERIRRVGERLSKSCADEDLGFRALRVDSSNTKPILRAPDATSQLELGSLVSSIKGDRSAEDLLFQVFLEWGLELSVPIVRADIGNSELFDVDSGSLVACFDGTINDEIVREMARRAPLRAVFRDDGFASDAARINAEQTFRELSPATEVKVI